MISIPYKPPRMRALVVVAALVGGCSWSRFDRVTDDSPVASLEKPKGMDHGFGNRLATTTLDGQARLFVTGSPGTQGAAAYHLGSSDQPTLDAVDARHCLGDNDPCYLAQQPAALPRGPTLGERLDYCFVAGLGVRTEVSGASVSGLVTRCEAEGGDVQFAYRLPDGTISDRVAELIADGIGDPVVLATDRGDEPLLVAVWPQERHVWFYLPGLDTPTLIDLPPNMADDTPSSATVLRADEDWLVVIGATKNDHVWLFRVTREGGVDPVGCLGGPAGLGRALAAGPVVDADHDDLAVSDEINVHVLAGSSLAALPATANPRCSLASLPQDALVASFGCGQTPAVEGCSNSQFGATLAIGDVDGDGDGEVAVGAPSMTVRGEARAGAILLYDAEGQRPHELTEVKFLSSAATDDQLGESLAMPRIDGRHVIAAGAPGGGKAVLFYCNDLLPSSLAGARCD